MQEKEAEKKKRKKASSNSHFEMISTLTD